MKKIRLNIDDLITVLESLRDSGGTTEIIILDHDGYPAIVDANEQENVIMFQVDESEPVDPEDQVH